MANKAIYQLVRQFDTAGGAGLWERIGAGQPAELLGYPAYEASAMDGSWNAAATANNYIMVLGDFSSYVIVDRVGMSVELVPHLFATGNNRPSGQRGFWAWWRTGADSVDDGAFTLLDLPTTA
jgi:HK97 family phage major capsid protein